MIITLAGQKGGSGKTTIAVNIACELHARGSRVLLVDADPQGSVLAWAGQAASADFKGPDVIAVGDDIRASLPGVAQGYDAVIIDTAGRQSRRLVGAIMLSDTVLLPSQPSPLDLWAMGDTIDTVLKAKELRPEIKVAIVLNADRNPAVSRALREAVEDTELPVLSTRLGHRVAFTKSLAAGLPVATYEPSGTAASEVRFLVDEITTEASIAVA